MGWGDLGRGLEIVGVGSVEVAALAVGAGVHPGSVARNQQTRHEHPRDLMEQ